MDLILIDLFLDLGDLLRYFKSSKGTGVSGFLELFVYCQYTTSESWYFALGRWMSRPDDNVPTTTLETLY